MRGIDFRILGSLEVVRTGEQIAVGGAKQRALLGFLLINANRSVSNDAIVEALWPSKASGSRHRLRVRVRLRRSWCGGNRD